MSASIFIVDCPTCRTKVAATETGRAERSGYDSDAGEPYAERLLVGICPACHTLIAGRSHQIDFADVNAFHDKWSDVTRVYPKPSKTFSSYRIPRVVTRSLLEADLSMQASANIAACAMLGRALEALCRDLLGTPGTKVGEGQKEHFLMLGEGIKALRDQKIIDDRLYDWSLQLWAFRNDAAHPVDVSISHEDAEDLQTFVHAIIEYIYDLTDRYNEFKTRLAGRAKSKKA